MHSEAMEWCRRWASDRSGNALDIGGRNVNGCARGLWPNMQWTVLDLEGDPANHLDRVIQADARDWIPDRAYDLVLCTELLEHVEGWPLCITTMGRALSVPEGLLVLTCAGPGRKPHSACGECNPLPGEYYQNIDPGCLIGHFRRFGFSVTVDIQGTDLRAVARW